MLAFSDLEPAGYGPRRVTGEEILAAFSDGLRINEIRVAVFESRTRADRSGHGCHRSPEYDITSASYREMDVGSGDVSSP